MTLVLTLLLHGCPIPAIVAACGLDERTVRAWLHKAGTHAALLHDQMVGGVKARQVQADEIRVRWTCSRTGSVFGKIFFGTNTRRKKNRSFIRGGSVLFTRSIADATLRF